MITGPKCGLIAIWPEFLHCNVNFVSLQLLCPGITTLAVFQRFNRTFLHNDPLRNAA